MAVEAAAARLSEAQAAAAAAEGRLKDGERLQEEMRLKVVKLEGMAKARQVVNQKLQQALKHKGLELQKKTAEATLQVEKLGTLEAACVQVAEAVTKNFSATIKTEAEQLVVIVDALNKHSASGRSLTGKNSGLTKANATIKKQLREAQEAKEAALQTAQAAQAAQATQAEQVAALRKEHQQAAAGGQEAESALAKVEAEAEAKAKAGAEATAKLAVMVASVDKLKAKNQDLETWKNEELVKIKAKEEANGATLR